ncbi:hypothetical protein MBLNU457_4810t2 [Dothideomycetes sp. NU457]
MEEKTRSFTLLKPPCTTLTTAIFSYKTSPVPKNVRPVLAALSTLHETLKTLATPSALNAKLADYTFYPLSQVLSSSPQLPIAALESVLSCLDILITFGWTRNVVPNLASQLLILLTLTADRSPKAPRQPTDELCVICARCLKALFAALGDSAQGRATLIAEGNVPGLGHAVTVLLELLEKGGSLDVEGTAVDALRELVKALKAQREVLASFLPGIVSVLSRVLVKTGRRRGWKVLREGILLFRDLLVGTVGDDVVMALPETVDSRDGSKNELSESWLKASAGQLKLALANINRLHSHERAEVREALLDLNVMILGKCSQSLANCRQLAVETALVLSEDEALAHGKESMLALLRTNKEIVDTLQSTFRDWTISLGRIMQGANDEAKQRRLKQLFTAFNLLMESEVDLQSPYRLLGSALNEGITTLLREKKSAQNIGQKIEALVLQDLSLVTRDTSDLTFKNPLAEFRSQRKIFDIIKAGIQSSATSTAVLQIGTDLAAQVRNTEGDAQVSAFWLLLQLLNTSDNANDISAFIDLGDMAEDRKLALREDIYSFALSTIEDEDSDTRLQALALEAIAFQAQKTGLDFRNELIDALYPILHQLGSSEPQVRSHAITCLNIVAEACGYSDVKDLVVANVDYLVNAVALRLNAFDVSPQGPQVMLMMVRLAGPSLLPYLEDTVESIFAALEDYHGYPMLVELLFAVLKTMAEEGVKAPLLAITNGDDTGMKSSKDKAPIDIGGLVQLLLDRKTKKQESEQDLVREDLSHPTKPWGKDKENDSNGIEELDEDLERSSGPAEDSPAPLPPSPKTYALLLKITQLTQHYLSSSSPSLRTSLLTLISTTIPALAHHEDSYLPLVNTLWPELVSRLHDEEPYIISGSLDVIAIMSQHAGSFMRTRIESLWPDLRALHTRLAKLFREAAPKSEQKRYPTNAVAKVDVGAVGYVDTSTKALWSSFQRLLIVCVQHVGIDAKSFDEVLAMLRPIARLDAQAINVLETENADATWLARFKEEQKTLRPPVVQGWKFAAAVY